jgi:integrase
MLTPCRPGEARAIKCGQVNLDRRSIYIDSTFSLEDRMKGRKAKKSKPYRVSIHEQIYDDIARRVRSCSPDDFLFERPKGGHYTMHDLNRMWEKIRAAAAMEGVEVLDGIRMYDATRHSAATIMAEKGATALQIQAALGHSRSEMSENYIHLAEDHTAKVVSILSLQDEGDKEELCHYTDTHDKPKTPKPK